VYACTTGCLHFFLFGQIVKKYFNLFKNRTIEIKFTGGLLLEQYTV
jgi:hypothetical protein